MRTTMKYTKKDQRGAVSLFIVVFSALLVTVVTVGFIQIMLRNQQEATTADLSQSAYDSALAGVEDAKRVLVAGATLDPNACDSVAKALDASSAGDETKIQQSEGDKALSQAYTCVKVERDTDDFAGKGLGGEQQSVVIPLKGQTAFNKVEISWGLADADQTATLPPAGTSLPRKGEWPINRPAVLRSQLIQFGSSFMTSDFDTKLDGASSPNALTKFLYPAVAGSTTASFLPNDSSPSPVKCNVNNSPYTCSITLDLPNPINGDSTNRTAFLRLSALYNLADYKVVLLNDTNVVKFAGVQAKVDSTGRAGDLFRRVVARVNLQLNDGFPYPEASIDLNGNLCKTFQVTDNAADYNAGGCQP